MHLWGSIPPPERHLLKTPVHYLWFWWNFAIVHQSFLDTFLNQNDPQRLILRMSKRLTLEVSQNLLVKNCESKEQLLHKLVDIK